MSELTTLLDQITKIAEIAGSEILGIYESDFAVSHKSDRSPLTEADLAAHRHIAAALGALTPALPVLSEEGGLPSFAERRKWRRYWLVDPLDGTKEFVNRNGEFTVNIALVEEHTPVMGVVVAPARGVVYTGAVGLGATRQQGAEPPQPIKVAGARPHDAPVRVVGSRSHRGTSLDGFLARLGSHEMVAMGSSLKLCAVAEGSADIYPRLGPTSEWDTAAAHAVVLAAGGQVVETNGEPLRYNVEEDILNPFFLVIGDPGRDWVSLLHE